MGLISIVRSFLRTEEGDAHVTDVKCDEGNGATYQAHHFGPPGDDSHPLPGDYVATVDSPGSGNKHVTGYIDPANEPEALEGEKRLYSRDGDGAVVAVVWLKNDGTLVLENDNGSIELAAGGTVTINGVTIDTDGNVSAPGEVTAMDATPATTVKLSTHKHPTAMGPSGSPTPGT